MKFNKKKLLMFGLPLLAVVVVSAVILTYYVSFAVTLDIEQPIRITYDESEVSGEISEIVPCTAGKTCLGKVIRIYNDGNEDKGVGIKSIGDGNVPIKYVGFLELSTKNTDTWELDGTKAKVKYNVVGNTIEAEVIEGIISGYELVYYKDLKTAVTLEDRTANPQPAIKLSAINLNLPYSDDGNIQEGADYTQSPDFYEHPQGAKIWYVDSDDIDDIDGSLTWANWGNFLYEIELIRHFNNAHGEIIVPAGDFVELYVEYSPNTYLSGNVEIITTIE